LRRPEELGACEAQGEEAAYFDWGISMTNLADEFAVGAMALCASVGVMALAYGAGFAFVWLSEGGFELGPFREDLRQIFGSNSTKRDSRKSLPKLEAK
jgi:hypothetical protein